MNDSSPLMGRILDNPLLPLPGALHFGAFYPVVLSRLDPLMDGRELPFLPLPPWPRPIFQQPWQSLQAGQWCRFRWVGFSFTLQRLVREPGLVVENVLNGPGVHWIHRRRLVSEAQGTVLLEEFVLNPGPLVPLVWLGLVPSILSRAFEHHHKALGSWLGEGTQWLASPEVSERLEHLDHP